MVIIRRISPALATTALLLWPLGLQAQEPDFDLKPNLQESKVPDVANGETLARKLCVGCHVLDAGADKVPQADVPSFQAIADRPNQTQETLTTWLLAPHAPMPDPHLERMEIRDLAGYIMSLRKAP
ncbi:MAG: c-type cytochrome [Hyphomicrobium sp.]|jgi:mono/diheme cytochrome c family protein